MKRSIYLMLCYFFKLVFLTDENCLNGYDNG